MVLQRESAMTNVDVTSRAPAAEAADDVILPFEVASLDLRGRVVRLGPSLDGILNAHAYPPAISKLLGEAIVLTVLLGSSLKFEGRFILQTKTDGPVRLLVVDYRSPGLVRACAQFDAAAVAGGASKSAAELLGRGHLAMTIDQGPEIIMIENYRSELIWKLMRQCPYIGKGLRNAKARGGWL